MPQPVEAHQIPGVERPSLTEFPCRSYTPCSAGNRAAETSSVQDFPPGSDSHGKMSLQMSDKHYTHHHDQTHLEAALRKSKPFFEEYGTTLIYALAAVLAVAAIVVYMQRQPPENADASRELAAAVSPSSGSATSQPELFRDVADNFPGTEIATWARLRQADRLLDNAITKLFTDRKTAIEELENAETAYSNLAERGDINDAIRERVMIGQARLAEARCDGTDTTTTNAVNAWKALVTQFPKGMLKKHAEDRIERLGRKSTQDFYAWFHAQNPKPGDALEMPADGPGQVPNIPDFSSLLNLQGDTDGSSDFPEADGPITPNIPTTPDTPTSAAPSVEDDTQSAPPASADVPEAAVPEASLEETAAPKVADPATPEAATPDTSETPTDE